MIKLVLFLVFTFVSLNASELDEFEKAYQNTFDISNNQTKQINVIRNMKLKDTSNKFVELSDTTYYQINSKITLFKSNEMEIIKDSNYMAVINFKAKSIVIHRNFDIELPFYLLKDFFQITNLKFDRKSEQYYVFSQDLSLKQLKPYKHNFAYLFITNENKPKICKIDFDYSAVNPFIETCEMRFEDITNTITTSKIENINSYLFKAFQVLKDQYADFKLNDLRKKG